MIKKERDRLVLERKKYKRLQLISRIVVSIFVAFTFCAILSLFIVEGVSTVEILIYYELFCLIICLIEVLLLNLLKKQKKLIRKRKPDLEFLNI